MIKNCRTVTLWCNSRNDKQMVESTVAENLILVAVVVEVLLYVHRNRRLIRDGSPGRPPRLSHSS